MTYRSVKSPAFMARQWRCDDRCSRFDSACTARLRLLCRLGGTRPVRPRVSGYSTLYVSDHLDAQFGPLVALTVAAEATSTLHVGSFVLNNDLRHPVVLAKEIATLGLAAEGRIEVGLGAGWSRGDYEQAGIEFDELAVRVDRLAESLAVMKALWTEGEANFAGTHYTVRDAQCDPRPAVAASRHGRRRQQAAAHAGSPRGRHRRDQHEPGGWREDARTARPPLIATTVA